ncbi:MAG: enhanced serine sensitivity protein SseB C-terminal domain-containing protein [Porcipelethomonas sp.]
MSAIQDLIVKYRENPNKEIYRAIITKIQNEESIWAAVSEASRNYYLGNENGGAAVYLFSEKEFGEKYAEHMKEKGITVNIVENKNELRMAFFGDIYRSGFDTVIMDNGQTYLRMNLFDIINKPDTSKLPKESRFVINPDLVRAANWFYQENDRGQASTSVWAALFKEIYSGEYIIPANVSKVKMEVLGKEFVVDKESEVVFPLLKNVDGKTFYPFFTDWNEFRKYDMKNEYSSLVGRFDDMKKLVKKADGVVINPYGSNIIITPELLGNIETAGRNAAGQNVKMKVGIPRVRPVEIERKITVCLEDVPGVRSASLRLADTDGKKKFIVCIDCEDFKAAAEKLSVLKFEHEFPVEFISCGSPLADAVFKDAEPFFSR